MDPSSVAPSTPLPTHHVKSFVTVLLDNTNYLTWKTQILNYFAFTDLTGYIDGTISKPSNDNNLSSLPNWTRFDRFVTACITSTLSDSLVHQATSHDTCTAQHLWDFLQTSFMQKSLARKSLPQTQLRYLHEGSLSISGYLQQIHHLSTSLAAIGTMLTASAHIITLTAVIGSGVLLYQLGLVAGPAVHIAFSFITYFISTLLAGSYRCPGPLHGTRNYTYMDVVRSHLGLRLVIVCLLLLLLPVQTATPQNQKNEVYIVYMGGRSNGDRIKDHADLVSSFTKRNKNVVLHTYNNGFLGFAARLAEVEAKSLARRPGVVSVFPNSVFQLQTTRSWDFLEQQMMHVEFDPASSSPTNDGADIIIGFLDSGIWPESESFNDADMGPIPSHWRGICMEGDNFTSSSCNRKLIGARYYDEFTTSRDGSGHGTHVASIAAGRPISDASYYDLARGTARGGAPSSRIAVYRVCTDDEPLNCYASAILKAFDDAIADGVDVLSISLGSKTIMPNFSNDPIAIGAFHAVEKGIIVVCAAGNRGPFPATVVNVAPWILTVAATTIDRDFEANVILGGNQKIRGRGINFSNLEQSPIYPLIDGESAKSGSNQQAEKSARNCNPDSLDGDKVKGTILICENIDELKQEIYKFETLKNNFGVIGMILINNNVGQVQPAFGIHPIVAITEDDGAAVISYIKSNSNPVATILPTIMVPNYKPAPVVGYFSSRGPTPGIQNLLKPDIAAPGVMILATWPAFIDDKTLTGREPPRFALLSGTSMACPHVSGLAARVKSQHPTWSPSVIKSSIMTTAIRTNNMDSPITTITGSRATPYDIGAGEVSVSDPIQPGLVYETGIFDYIIFLCDIGYEVSKIKLIAPDVPDNFSCPPNKSFDSISNMNYPSIVISNLTRNEVKTVTRTVTNVGGDDSTYDVIIEAPTGVDVQVIPDKLHFTKDVHKLQFQVAFKVSAKSEGDIFGSIAWSNEKCNVRSPFVVITRSDATYSGNNISVSFIFLFCCQMLIAWLLYLN